MQIKRHLLALAGILSALTPAGLSQGRVGNFQEYANGVYSVNIEGRPTDIQLRPHNVRSSNFRLSVAVGSGQLLELPPPAAQTVRGSSDSWPSLAVAGELTETGARLIAMDAESGRTWDLVSSGNFSALSATRTVPMDMDADFCGVKDSVKHSLVDAPRSGQQRSSGPWILEVTMETDAEFIAARGGSLAGASAYLESLVNLVSQSFEFNSNVEVRIAGLVLRPVNLGLYTSNDPSALLVELREFWRNREDAGDLVHLVTGKDLDTDTIGIAYVGQVACGDFAAGLTQTPRNNSTSQYPLSTVRMIMAHELGHNMNEQHCDGSADCRLMCSNLGCAGGATTFAPNAAGRMTSVAQSRPCIDRGPTLSLPVEDQTFFTNFGPIDRDVWQSSYAAEKRINATLGTGRAVRLGKISQTATGFPQAFTPAQAFAQTGDIDMNLILSAQIRVKLYADLATSQGDIKFECRDQNDSWINITPSSGLNLNSGSFATVSIPSAGIHSNAAIRVTNESVASDDFVYLREFRIDGQGCTTSLGTFCAPLTPNSVSANGSTMQPTGSFSLSQDDLVFEALDLPQNEFGQYVMGGTLLSNPVLLGMGTYCVTGNPSYRFPPMVASASNPTAWMQVFSSTLYALGVLPGDTVHFQYAYRDGATANVSSGVSIRFCF